MLALVQPELLNIKQEIREEMTKIQAELEQALKTILQDCGTKIKDNERQEIEQEFKEIQELLERLKTGFVWVVLFGKTSVGKSAVLNSLMNNNVAKVGVEHDVTNEPKSYTKEPWKLVDVPGTMGTELNEKKGIDETKNAHGVIFVIDGEPYQDEIEFFDVVHNNSPNIPKIVFVNKWDMVENNRPKKDQEIIRSRISEKMSRFVKFPEDIVYGSAMVFDQKQDKMTPKEIPQLLDRLYENAGTLSTIMNILDPAERASQLNDGINNRISKIRLQIAHKIINNFSKAAALSIPAPAFTLTVYPLLLASMAFIICQTMGKKVTKTEAGQILWACLKIMGISSIGRSATLLFTDAATTALTPLGGLGLAIGALASVSSVGWFCYSQTAQLGEIILEYIRNDFSWGDQEPKRIIDNCRKRVEEIYLKPFQRG